MSTKELREALDGPDGALDAYLETRNDREIKADIKALIGDATAKREHFAAMAMQGVCANGPFAEATSNHPEGVAVVRRLVAEASVAMADALIAELSK